LARAPAAREGQVIVCEGYTDTIALHQAGMRNAVGLMGTALTGDQVGELARMAPTVLLALDADSSGQEAMLRASALAAKRKLELRVVELPAGTDPADLLQGEGADAMRALAGESVPFVRFRVERVLAEGDHASAEGRDRMLERLRPVFATLPASAMRMELTEIVSERLRLPQSLAERALAAGGMVSTTRAAHQEAAGGLTRERAHPSAAGRRGKRARAPQHGGQARLRARLRARAGGDGGGVGSGAPRARQLAAAARGDGGSGWAPPRWPGRTRVSRSRAPLKRHVINAKGVAVAHQKLPADAGSAGFCALIATLRLRTV